MWEKEKMLVVSIFDFPTMFSKGFFLKVVKIPDCVVRVNTSLYTKHSQYPFCVKKKKKIMKKKATRAVNERDSTLSQTSPGFYVSAVQVF